MIGDLTKEEKTAEAGKTSDQSENYDVESVIRAASCTLLLPTNIDVLINKVLQY